MSRITSLQGQALQRVSGPQRMEAEGTFYYFDVGTLSKREQPHITNRWSALSTGRRGRGTQDTGQSLQDTCGWRPNALSTGALLHPLRQIWANDLLKSLKAPAPIPQSPMASAHWHWGLGEGGQEP